MEDRQERRGFVITVGVKDEVAGGSMITLMIATPLKRGDIQGGSPIPKPERYRSSSTGAAAVSEAIDRAKNAIDDALAPRDPFGD
ncbi:hypothetical protein [Paraburkholderia solisilvae]|uniref:Uncharacterized protein n=1 Tax=Paraburkholderia solisilvae TaxID=624376 RepID=A0A6J5EEV4_9BURK|nr:hypothetical protein [Paraburkholderia solisilvae]CAB3765098.1 hypothetical protein LMG29739_04512 [Paraburkholderia solisilvae]